MSAGGTVRGMEPVVIIMALLYFLPTLVAMLRSKNNTPAIVILNLFLGWTFVGWVIALVWAVSKDQEG